MEAFDLANTIIIIIIVVFVVFGLFSLVLRLISSGKKTLKEPPKSLLEADELLIKNFNSLAATRAFAAVETALKDSLKSELTVFELIDLAAKQKILTPQSQSKAHNLRIKRNKLVHEQDSKFKQQDAIEFLRLTREILAQLGYRTK